MGVRRPNTLLVGELVMDNLGMCRFHRGWAEEMLPEVVGSLYGAKEAYLRATTMAASRNASVFWETERSLDFVHLFLRRRRLVEGD